MARVAALKPDGGAELDEAAFAEGKKRFTDALDNDLNTSLAITAVYDVFKLKTNDKTKLALLSDFEKVLGLGILERAEAMRNEEKKTEENSAPEISRELSDYINQKIAERIEAKANKNYALADAIRAELLSKGITLIDTKEGTKFSVAE